jgi:hypothetical protein
VATVSSLGSTFNTTAGTKTVVATPALLDFIIVITCTTGQATAVGLSDNSTAGHGTYYSIVNALKNTSADRLEMWIRADRIMSATSTTWTMTTGGSDTGGGLQVFKITGMTIAAQAAIRQSGSQANQAGSTTPAPSLGAAALTGNPLIGAVFNGTNPATMTPPTSWTESVDTGWATPTTGIETVFISSGFTGSTVTWGSATTVYCDVAAEFKADQGDLGPTFRGPRSETAVRDRATWMRKWENTVGSPWQRRRSGLLVPA